MNLIELIEQVNQSSPTQHGTDKETNHAYITNFYEQEFLPFRNKEIKLLEIGIYTGDSLILWDKYFFNAQIWGIDIDDSRITTRIDSVNYLFGDAYSQEVVGYLSNFDIIIDDGPHSFETQYKFIELYYPKLNKGGLMVIEDLHHNTELIDELIKLAENLGAKCEFIDTGKLYNSKLISIKKL